MIHPQHAGDTHISCFSENRGFTRDAVCAALDALRGATLIAIRIHRISGIPASALSHHSSLRRLDFSGCDMPLRDLAGYTQLHGLRELICFLYPFHGTYEMRHVQPLSQLEVLDVMWMQTAGAADTLAALPRLRELGLSYSDLRTVPASVSSLTRLTRLALTGTQVADGWEHLAGMQQLADLSVGACNLTVVPPEFSLLAALTRLDDQQPQCQWLAAPGRHAPAGRSISN